MGIKKKLQQIDDFRRKTEKPNFSRKFKDKARAKARAALVSGKIKKTPCVNCGSNEKVCGHHEDYEKPLEVIWLCTKCHHELHKKARKEEFGPTKTKTLVVRIDKKLNEKLEEFMSDLMYISVSEAVREIMCYYLDNKLYNNLYPNYKNSKLSLGEME